MNRKPELGPVVGMEFCKGENGLENEGKLKQSESTLIKQNYRYRHKNTGAQAESAWSALTVSVELSSFVRHHFSTRHKVQRLGLLNLNYVYSDYFVSFQLASKM